MSDYRQIVNERMTVIHGELVGLACSLRTLRDLSPQEGPQRPGHRDHWNRLVSVEALEAVAGRLNEMADAVQRLTLCGAQQRMFRRSYTCTKMLHDASELHSDGEVEWADGEDDVHGVASPC